ncbi:cob(I)yrinic acid a,c-diamide adenosyltransferase [Verrucomicrobium sp. BvORR034]|jgi:cob(I)alamin adenosyltransferase|uniref:cob(I)yrinic acid a,c-diamide adenosyltransferase n=1 Tax=Verrucomicrobium sp. BvORR034 TaxID=1396418 RepID=UPI0006795F83|nr:cob(I)yrinic acid a,c-diamide adenosyltransferase [Verrucomicrobium sp. BvORR034]
MSITTRRGDSGETDLLFGCRVKKSYPRIDAIGCVDELNAALGLLRVTGKTDYATREVHKIQLTLIALMGELATPPGEEERYAASHPQRVNADSVDYLDALVSDLEMAGALKFHGWALPGAAGSLGGAHADVARTVCRRAERCVVLLEGTPEAVPNAEIVRYLNRLSDVLWLIARLEEKGSSGAEAAAPAQA